MLLQIIDDLLAIRLEIVEVVPNVKSLRLNLVVKIRYFQRDRLSF